MQILFALMAILWWIALYGLAELMTEKYTRRQKCIVYVSILVCIGVTAVLFPKALERL
jgi:xanthine/uracil permease